MTRLNPLPTTIQSISNNRWTDTLTWTVVDNYAMAEVDNDWRIWVHTQTDACVVRNKSELRGKQFATLEDGLAFLDYRPFRH